MTNFIIQKSVSLTPNSYISKQDTTRLKGLAILIMLIHHLFLNTEKCIDMKGIIQINQLPLAYYLGIAGSVCVDIYLILSGYGLWIGYQNQHKTNNIKRILKLFLLVSFVGLIFYPWHTLLNPSLGWTFGIKEILACCLGFRPYNIEWWFIFPWVLVCITSNYIFSAMNKYNWKIVFIIAALSYPLAILLLHFTLKLAIDDTWFGHLLLELFFALKFVFPFVSGSLLAKTGFLKYCLQATLLPKILLWILLIITAITIMSFDTHKLIHVPFAILFCLCFVSIKSKILYILGVKSTEMWLCHTFFCYYYFSSFYYSLTYPIVILSALIITSFISALIIQKSFNQIYQRIGI